MGGRGATAQVAVGAGATAAAVQRWCDLDLRAIKLDDSGADGFKRSWLMLMPEGKYEHPQYGELNFSEAKLNEFKRHFDQRVRKIDVAFDRDHDAKEATGWLEQVEIRPALGETPTGLWGLVCWTSLGEKLLSERIYRYFSPEFGDYTDEASGQVFHNVIIGGALTNRPYLKVMPAVTLSEITLAEGVSQRSWGSVNKSELPRSCFLIQGDASDKSSWKLPIYEGAGSKDAEGHYTKRGPLNINAVRAALAAIGGARQGKPMRGVPGNVKAKLENLLKRYGGGGEASSGQNKTGQKASEGGGMANKKLSGGATQKSVVPDGEDQPDYSEDSQEFEDASDSQEYDDAGMPAEFDEESDTHAKCSTDGHAHGKFAEHSHDGDADHSDAPLKAGKKMSKKASDRYANGRDSGAEVVQLREELAQMRYKLYEKEVGETLTTWSANQFQFSEGAIRKHGNIALSKSFRESYQKFMLSEGIRLAEKTRQGLNKIIEMALSTAVVDLTARGSSFDQEGRRTIRGGEQSFGEDASREMEQEAEKIALSEFHKPINKLSRAEMLDVYARATEATGYGQKRA